MNTQDSNQATIQNLPDPVICRVKKDPDRHFVCLVEDPTWCPHVFSFGFRHFCYHPKRENLLVGNSS